MFCTSAGLCCLGMRLLQWSVVGCLGPDGQVVLVAAPKHQSKDVRGFLHLERTWWLCVTMQSPNLSRSLCLQNWHQSGSHLSFDILTCLDLLASRLKFSNWQTGVRTSLYFGPCPSISSNLSAWQAICPQQLHHSMCFHRPGAPKSTQACRWGQESTPL